MMHVLVCGGRGYRLTADDRAWLDALHATHDFTEVLHGGARGADVDAATWARGWRIPVRVFRAQWGLYGNAAGPLRNAQMLRALCTATEPPQRLVLGFPGGKGTADMLAQVRAAGVMILQYGQEVTP